jgi:hypothetical protein
MPNRIQGGAAPTGDRPRTASAPLKPAAAPTTAHAPGAAPTTADGFAGTLADPFGFLPPIWNFVADKVHKFYDASKERTRAYDFGKILTDVPAIWSRTVASDIRKTYQAAAVSVKPKETYGELFKRVGTEMGVDPYALAAYCIFESYNGSTHSYNPQMTESSRGMYAAGIAATQAQDWKGKTIPGLKTKFPASRDATIKMLRANPEYSLRCLASEMKEHYAAAGNDLAKAFPLTAYPAWGDPNKSRGNYGTQAQYVSRAYALYQQFKEADHG